MFCTNKLLRTDYSYFINESPNRLFSDIGASSTYEAYCNNITSLIAGVVPILVLYILTAFIFKNSLKREDIIVLYLFIPLLLASFQRIYECVLKFFTTKPYIEVFKKYSSLENESKGDVKLDKFENIKIKDVRVSLSNDKTIEIPNMLINKGDRVLIKGASGIGKSTLFNIILGLRN